MAKTAVRLRTVINQANHSSRCVRVRRCMNAARHLWGTNHISDIWLKTPREIEFKQM